MCGYMTWIVRVQVRSFAARELSAGGEYRKTVVLYGGGEAHAAAVGAAGCAVSDAVSGCV